MCDDPSHLFDAFDEDPVPSRSREREAQLVEDKMKRLEEAKQQDARAMANQLLSEMFSATPASDPLKSPHDEEDDSPAVKRLKDSHADDETGTREMDEEGLGEETEDGMTLEMHRRIQIHRIESEEKCIHEVCLPADMSFSPLQLPDSEPAKTYEFKLDPFQKEAILCLDNNQSVLVSAHTSAGKTVVAQCVVPPSRLSSPGLRYAIALSLRDKQRVIYTSPIKALSNQKYRELQEEFFDVGLMTGDVTLNPDASCLVMTTEILRSMLYRGSELMREVGWVVFDEIHYMRDKERGVVWEETIILLPDNVRYVFLSATIPNARQFAEWVCFLHNQPCHVVYTDYRPTPLQHFIYPAGGDGLYEVVNLKGEFREENFAKAMSYLSDSGDSGGRGGLQRGRKGGTQGESNVTKIIRTMNEKDLIPCIVFSFSRKECEAYATSLKDLDFNDDDAKKLVREVFTNAMDLLSDEDRKLPQIGQVLPYLLRGIGIHHSGLLPILKETIEILFGEGLIKTLFATETFSMGLNMPARTVIFTSARKFDGKDYRWISSGEYIQMSGRAGRRGKDTKGVVILMVDQQLGADIAKQIIKGASDPINSQFRLTYNMVLNLLRVEGINPEFMLEHSFYQFQNYSALPDLYTKVRVMEERVREMRLENEIEIAGFYQMEKQIEVLSKAIRKTINQPKHVVPFLQPGRLFHIEAPPARDFGWGALINYHKRPNPLDPLSGQLLYILDVALVLSQDSAKDPTNVQQLRPPANGEKGVVEIVQLTIDCVRDVSAARIKYPSDLKSYDSKQIIARTIQEVLKRFNGLLPLLDPIQDMKIKDESLVADIQKLANLEQRRDKHPIKKSSTFHLQYRKYEEKLEAEGELRAAKAELKKAKSLLQLDELKCRKRVLRRIKYCDDNDVITQKGRVACEISAADELLLTEMIFGGLFNALSPQQAAALLSCFVFEERVGAAKLADDLSGCLRQMQEYARRIAKVSIESKLEMDEEKYVDSFKPQLMDVVHAWCSGASFAEILKNSDVFEGSIIRCLRRLEELLREMVNASKSIGSADLEAKFEDARKRLKRDIVFAASLYL